MRAWILAGYLFLTAALSMVALVQVFPKTNQTAVQIVRSGSDGAAALTESAAGDAAPVLGFQDGPSEDGPSQEGEPVPGDGEPEWTLLDELEFGKISLFGWTFKPGKNSGQGLLVMALLAGILGSFMHAAQSLTSYVGNQTFKSSWILWYVLRAPIGAVLGVFMYFVLRAGLLSANSAVVSPYGVVTLAGLGGWFSKQATDKLAELFDRFFESGTDAKRQDKLGAPVVAVSGVTVKPDSAGGQVLTLAGTGFAKGLVVVLGSVELPAVVVSPERATVTIPKDTFAAGAEPATLVVKVGGKVSEPVGVDLA